MLLRMFLAQDAAELNPWLLDVVVARTFVLAAAMLYYGLLGAMM